MEQLLEVFVPSRRLRYLNKIGYTVAPIFTSFRPLSGIKVSEHMQFKMDNLATTPFPSHRGD